MVNEAIVEGIKNALSKGESLKSAMQSFINAGYPLTDVENASRNLQTLPAIIQKPGISTAKISRPVQQISEYSGSSEGPSKALIIGLIILLIAIISFMAGLLIFKDEVITLLGKIF